MVEEKTNLVQERLAKIEKIQKLGHNPYPYSYDVDSKITDIKQKYEDKLQAHEQTKDYVKIAGRIMLKRGMGKVLFMDIQDEDAKIQLFFRADDLNKKFELSKLIDLGDIIGVYGYIFKTKMGELSIFVEDFEILCKCLTELGDKFHGIKDVETKYRNRSLDMIMNPTSREILKKRFLITQKIREFMTKEGYLEIETPINQVTYGGAAAKPFITHHNDLDMDLYLRVSPEQSLKRVLCGGMEAVFEINKNFRNEDIDRTHNPEFTMMEAYKAYVDYEEMMSLVERLTEFVAKEVLGTTKIEFAGKKMDVKAPWKRITTKDALKQAKGWDVDKMSDKELFDEVKKLKKEMYHKTRGEAILILFEEYGEPIATQPTHFIDYPKESTPLCKRHRKDENLIERFESFVCGMEICNAYSELNDAILQRKLFEEQVKHAQQGNEETWGSEIDEEFLEALELGMPPAGGIGIGIDRLVMLLLNQESIRDIIFFPTMKPKKKEKQESKAEKPKDTNIATAIINKEAKLEKWQELNTIAHLNAAFGARAGKILFMQDKITTKDNQNINLNIQHAIMIKESKSDSKLKELIRNAQKENLEISEFTKEMLLTINDKKVAEQTKEKKFKEIEHLGVLVFGKKSVVDKLTKEFELYK